MLERAMKGFVDFLLRNATCNYRECPVTRRRQNCSLVKIQENIKLSADAMLEFGSGKDPDGLTQKLTRRKHCIGLVRQCAGWEKAVLFNGCEILKYPPSDD